MSNLAPMPFLWFGPTYAGYLLFTYAAGTSNPQTTSTDSTGATPNTNPMVLDANGSVSCWLTPGVLYKFVLAAPGSSNPPQAPIWTQDNITLNSSYMVLGSLTALRAVAKGTMPFVFVITPAGGGGIYQYESADTTSADNGGTIIVATDNGRYYLLTSWK